MLSVLFFAAAGASAAPTVAEKYPMGPDPRLTRGSLCQRGNTTRYPERIRYCARSVGSDTKDQIITDYERLGYQIRSYGRKHFKIDHYIPLCLGGSNNVDNLWPQHEEIYLMTDKIEQYACEVLAQGRMRQAELVQMIRDVKNNLSTARQVEDRLERLR